MYREAEVTHGRISMLAVVGFLTQENFHFLFVEPDKDIGPAIRHLDEVRAVNPIFFEGLGFVIACCELYRALNGWIAQKTPTPTWTSSDVGDEVYVCADLRMTDRLPRARVDKVSAASVEQEARRARERSRATPERIRGVDVVGDRSAAAAAALAG